MSKWTHAGRHRKVRELLRKDDRLKKPGQTRSNLPKIVKRFSTLSRDLLCYNCVSHTKWIQGKVSYFLRLLVDKIKSINPWHFLWIGVIVSEVLTLAASTIQSYLWWGYVPSEVLIIGAGDALLVPLVVVAITIIFVSRISKLEQELESRREAEEKIRVLAYYDSLTDLPNRTFFTELLRLAIAYARRHKLTMALLFIDLDNFKRVNDTLGHDMGDKLLLAVKDRLLASIRDSDYIARLDEDEMTDVVSRMGGDEFILLLHNIAHVQDSGKVAIRILEDLSEPFHLNGREVFITASIGISLYPTDAEDGNDMLKNADVAMYHAKSAGKNAYQFYSKSMTDAALEHMILENKLRKALESKEFLLYYQPKQSLSGGKIVGLEALLRWRQADGDMLLPTKFISLAEEAGLIIPIGEWVLSAACLQNKAWHEAGYGSIVVSVNLSNRQFDQKDLIEVVTRALRNVDLHPRYLELEITESAVMQNPEEAIATLHKLRDLGVQISIDDFGTGYSSLNYLRRLPLDSLKIDRSFVMNLSTNSSDAAIVKAIIVLAHSLNLKVVAEGVETEQQLAFLRESGCDEIQGYLLSRPLPVGEISKVLAGKLGGTEKNTAVPQGRA
jgi:diguanylate cyclase (GGDEF)-like protein